MAYATVEELEAGWRTLTEAEADRAEVLLDRASAFLDGVIAKYHIDAVKYADALSVVCCDLVQRKMERPTSVPVSSETHSVGPFSETMSYAYPTRKSWELYPEDLAMLGVKKSRWGTVKVAIHDRSGESIDW
jgi:hypothetical protein